LGVGCSPQVWFFGWKAYSGILSTKMNIIRRLPSFGMSCHIYGCAKKSDVHMVLECPLEECIWLPTLVERDAWGGRYKTVKDCIECAAKRLGPEELGECIAILWECYNAHNRFNFWKPDSRLEVLGDIVRSYREAMARGGVCGQAQPCS